jgi:CIC family chloride channel protein
VLWLVNVSLPIYWNHESVCAREIGSLQAKTNSTTVGNRLGAILIRLTPTERQRLLVVTIIIGGVCGLVAVSFHVGIDLALALLINRALSVPNISWIFWSILTPALGGLVVGLALHYWVPGAVGSGIPQVKLAYARYAGHIPFRDAIGKFVLGVVQIGSGGSLGREGPTVQICAGVSSFLARLSSLSRQSQRRMTPVGVAAGIAAAFNAPIAAVTFTVEEIIGDLDQTMLSGVIVAAAIAAAVERAILGQHPVFEIHQAYTLGHATSLVSYTVLGLLSAIASVAFTDSLLGLRAWFKRFRLVPKWAHPAMGGVVTGALVVLAFWQFKQRGIAGGGYTTLALALTGSLPVKVMIGLCLLKLVATVCSYASGGAGGLFAPALFIGGMLGGTIGYIDVNLFHHSPDTIGAFALVGMGAVFAGIIRAPMTSVIIIFEMTGSYGLILPLMIANMSAYGLARHWRTLPIYDALLLQDGVVLPHGRPITENTEVEMPGEVPP